MSRYVSKPSVLFLCVHNAGRSQMAAGFMRHFAEGQVHVFSAGSEPADRVNPVAIAAMSERGIDITNGQPAKWTDEEIRAADIVITMGCGDSCPIYPGTRYIDWDVEDPAGQPIEAVRPIRDELEERVHGLIAELGVEVGP